MNSTPETKCLFNPNARWRGFVFLALATLAATSRSSAASLYSVLPVTSKILEVYIEDGHVKYYGPKETLAQNVVYSNPVDLVRAMQTGNYTIESADDSAYVSPRSPIAIGRKSKGIYYHDPYDTTRPKNILGHQIYLELPTALVQGKSYTLQLNSLTENRSAVSFVYDVAKLRSGAVHVNEIGFAPSAVKYGYISQWMGSFDTTAHSKGGLNLDDRAGSGFRVINRKTGATAYTGTITKRWAKTLTETSSADYAPERNFSHADVWEANFSALTTPGEYILAVDGIGSSYPFEIGADVHRETFYYVLKGLFAQRQGIVKEFEAGKVLPRDHHPDDLVWRYDANWPGNEQNTGFNPAAPRVYGIWGYYHDAGDWDSYIRHALAPMHLYLLFDLAPEKFRDGDVGNRYKLAASDPNWIDEGSNGLPDLLDEASWLLNYFKRAKDALIAQGFGTGGVPGYVGRDAIAGNNISAFQDTAREWYVSQENVSNTYYFATLAAWHYAALNRFYQLTHPGQNHPDAAAWLTEARNAWDWSNARSATNSAPREVAAAALYRATGEVVYQTAYKAAYQADTKKNDGEWASPNEFDFAMSIYALLPANHPNLDTAFHQQVKTFLIDKTDTVKLAHINQNAFRNGMEGNQTFILGAFATPRQTLLPVAYKLTADIKYLNALENVTSYALGGNQLNNVYVSGLGDQPDNAIFHPTGWFLYRANHLAYDDEVFPGFTPYFGAVSFWFTQSVYSEWESRAASFPDAHASPNGWPESESRFANRFSIQGGEFTLDQQLGYTAYAYGFLDASAQSETTRFAPNVRPTVSLNLTEGQIVSKAGASLTVSASADTRIVRYFYNWLVIGESSDPSTNFQVLWTPPVPAGTSVLVTAIAYDDRGKISLPAASGQANVTVQTGGTVAVTGVSVSLASISIAVGATRALTATVIPANASNSGVTWSTLNSAVATVSNSGVVTGVAPGSTTVRVTTADGGFTAATEITVVPAPANSAALVNIATRAYCGTGNSVTIGGFVISGGTAKRVLVRAVGPTLITYGIGSSEVLLDPTVDLYRNGAVIASNDNWGEGANSAEITAVGSRIGAAAFAGADTKSSALLLTLDPGVYSFVVRGKSGTSGIVLLEVYDADVQGGGSNLVNIATRADCTTGNGVTIGGFVISGSGSKRVLVRAVGPTLTTHGIGAAEVLSNPEIQLYRDGAVTATNDNWAGDGNADAIVAAGARIGASPFSGQDTQSSALLLTLPAGVYSFIARGKNDATGIVLVEIYDAD